MELWWVVRKNLVIFELIQNVYYFFRHILIFSYTKPKGQIPDYEAPVILPANQNTVEDLCMRIHKTILSQLKYALVWGSSVKHMPQKVGKDHVLKDEDIVQIVKKYFFC